MNKQKEAIIWPLFLVFFVSLLISSCATQPPVKVYFVENGQLQYYLRPTKLNGDGSKAFIDLTYREGTNENLGFITCNFTIDGKSLTNIDEAYFLFEGKKYSLADLASIYVKRNEKIIRYTTKWDKDSFFEWLRTDNFTFVISSSGETFEYKPTKSFQKSKHYLSYELLP
ncbi:hypothetical protein [Spirochaeta cellobiosiphila]|uniref:hypothetical protein n=1 Tax=Spirochaeta cellobiosiphila TaxID=504483 RepID=UPI00040F6916|nr:hypothetical protein [Spirochaeta cellobiosiphila]